MFPDQHQIAPIASLVVLAMLVIEARVGIGTYLRRMFSRRGSTSFVGFHQP